MHCGIILQGPIHVFMNLYSQEQLSQLQQTYSWQWSESLVRVLEQFAPWTIAEVNKILSWQEKLTWNVCLPKACFFCIAGVYYFLLSHYMWVKIYRHILISINTFVRLIHVWEVGSNKSLWLNCTLQGSHFVFLGFMHFTFSYSHYFTVNFKWSKYFTHVGKYEVHQYHPIPYYHFSWISKKARNLTCSQNYIKLSLGFDFHSFCSKRQLQKEEYVQ